MLKPKRRIMALPVKAEPTQRIVIIMDALPGFEGANPDACNLRVEVTSSVNVATAERLFATLPDYLGQLKESAVAFIKRQSPPVLVVPPLTEEQKEELIEALYEHRGSSIVRPHGDDVVVIPSNLPLNPPPGGGEAACASKREWRFIEGNNENLRAMPIKGNIELLFDDGSIHMFDEDFPFAKIIAWRETALKDEK